MTIMYYESKSNMQKKSAKGQTLFHTVHGSISYRLHWIRTTRIGDDEILHQLFLFSCVSMPCRSCSQRCSTFLIHCLIKVLYKDCMCSILEHFESNSQTSLALGLNNNLLFIFPLVKLLIKVL